MPVLEQSCANPCPYSIPYMHTHFLLLMLNTLNITFISLFTSVFLLHCIDRKTPIHYKKQCRSRAVVRGGRQGDGIFASRDVVTPGSA